MSDSARRDVRIGPVRFISGDGPSDAAHVRVTVRSDPEGHGALMGTLTMRSEEWRAFVEQVERLEQVADAARQGHARSECEEETP